jgi:hypothetical protein
MGLRQSYVAGSLRNPEARAAAVITAGVALVVGALARVPLRGDVVVDLREGDRVGGLQQVTVIGFWVPTADGRETRGTQPRVIFNRPLPTAFELRISARSVRPEEIPVEIHVGETVSSATFGKDFAEATLDVDNPTGARQVGLALPRNATLTVRTLAVHPVADAGGRTP